MTGVENLLTQLINRLDPVATYYATDLDESGDPKYYGFMTTNGFWYIMRITNAGAVRYTATANSSSDIYANAWINRAILAYDYPNKVGLR